MFTNIVFQQYWNTKIAIFRSIFTLLVIFRQIMPNFGIQNVSLGYKKDPAVISEASYKANNRKRHPDDCKEEGSSKIPLCVIKN